MCPDSSEFLKCGLSYVQIIQNSFFFFFGIQNIHCNSNYGDPRLVDFALKMHSPQRDSTRETPPLGDQVYDLAFSGLITASFLQLIRSWIDLASDIFA